MIRARPEPNSREFGETAGAFINAWIAHPNEAVAEQTAREAIAQQHWRIEEVEQQAVVTRETCGPEKEHREYFEQALQEGIFLVFHCWPPDGERIDDDDAPSGRTGRNE